MTQASAPTHPPSCFGYCADCERLHALPEGGARVHGLELMREFGRIRRLDYLVPEASADPRLSFDQLFPARQSNMFGVLECGNERGETVVLRAFSSLRRGIREVAGWVPPILSAKTYCGLIVPEQARIEDLTQQMQRLAPQSSERRELADRRARLSRALFEEMQRRYRFHNFRGESRLLRDAYLSPGAGGIPGGVGECCAPKLLNYAATHGLRPLSLAEFHWGASRPGPGRAREQGQFYASCERRCQPILGFMLCGLHDAD